MLSLYNINPIDVTYSNAIKATAVAFANCFYLDFIKQSSVNLSTPQYLSENHFSTPGYVAVSKEIEALVNTTVKENVPYFKLIGLNS